MLSALVAVSCAAVISSQTPAAEAAMRRVFLCVGPDAKIEIFVPERLIRGTGVENADLAKQVTGAYSLDLTDAGKGKILEPIRVRYSPDRKLVIVDQFTRKLPAAAIPVAGGTVDFDRRFATAAKCGAFNDE
jgi:hypothetical protein